MILYYMQKRFLNLFKSSAEETKKGIGCGNVRKWASLETSDIISLHDILKMCIRAKRTK